MKNIITLRKEKEEYILYSPKMRAYIKLKEEIIDEIFKIMKNEKEGRYGIWRDNEFSSWKRGKYKS